MNYRQRGFTIVELLIVIVVIAVLAIVSVVAFNGIQERARLSAHKSNLSSIAKAIEMYYADNNAYPGAAASGCVTWVASPSTGALYTGLVPSYISKPPSAPSSSDGSYYAYCWSANSVDYKLLRLVPSGSVPAVESASAIAPFLVDPNRGTRGWAKWSSGGSAL